MSALTPKPPRESEVVMTQMILPSDANNLNAAFGGRVLAWIDICAAVASQRHCRQVVVTASMDELHFHAAIRVGWIVILKAKVLAAFKTSMEVGVTVTAENPLTGERHAATSALLTFVALNAEGKPSPVPPVLPETADEKAVYAEAQERRAKRLAHRGAQSEWQRVLSR